jgi:hypothetical protein
MYYVLDCFFGPGGGDPVMLGYTEDDEDRSWHSGVRFTTPPPDPIEVEIDPDYDGELTEFTDEPLPLMSKRMLAALRQAGVNNLDTYRVVIRHPETKQTYDNYVAFNLIGKIAAADLSKSAYDPSIKWFDSIVLNEKATRGVLMFRLAESLNAIFIHEKVKDRLQAAGLNSLVYIRPEEWAG